MTNSDMQDMENQRASYLINKEYNKFAALCDPDLRYVHSNGDIDDLSSYLQKLQSGFYNYQEMTYTVDNVIDMQSYILVTGELHIELTIDDQPRSLQNRALSLWKKEQGRLKFLMYQGTPVSD